MEDDDLFHHQNPPWRKARPAQTGLETTHLGLAVEAWYDGYPSGDRLVAGPRNARGGHVSATTLAALVEPLEVAVQIGRTLMVEPPTFG